MASQSRTPTTSDLFSAPLDESALAELQNWFEAWLARARDIGRLRQTSSEEVYRAMWGGFIEWCVSQQPVVRLLTVSMEDLRLFLASRAGHVADGDLSSRYAWRLLNLIDRVLRFAAREGGTATNTAAADLIAALPGVRNANFTDPDLPVYLPADEARRLVTYLSHVRPRGDCVAVPRDWHELRNRAAVGLQLGAGLTPGDIRALRLPGVIDSGGPVKGIPWKLVVPADGNTPERETPVAQWAGQLLHYWLSVRTALGIPGDWVFPSTATGKQWSKSPQHASVREVLEAAGVDLVMGGSFRLRHTFALRQLRRGKSPADVARWMGIVNVAEMERYTRVLTTPVDVV
jgi:integrase